MVEYQKGDLLGADVDIIAHQVNCEGVMNVGLSKELRTRTKNLLKEYKDFCKEQKFNERMLGMVQIVEAEFYSTRKQLVANLFGQFTKTEEGVRNTDYTSLKQALTHLRIMCETLDFATKDGVWRIGLPDDLGCEFGIGEWRIVDKIIHDVFDRHEDVIAIIFSEEQKDVV